MAGADEELELEPAGVELPLPVEDAVFEDAGEVRELELPAELAPEAEAAAADETTEATLEAPGTTKIMTRQLTYRQTYDEEID